MDTTALKTLPEILDDNQAPVTNKIADDGKQFVIIPKNMRIESVKKIRDEDRIVPAYRIDTVRTHHLPSFIDHIRRYQSADSVLFADQPKINGNAAEFSMDAVIDYHPAGTDITKAGGENHQIVYQADLHVRIARWLSHERNPMPQADFAAFIEDNLSDLCMLDGFTPPFGSSIGSPADLLTLSRGLEVRVNQTVRNATRLASGETCLIFTTENTRQDGSELLIPEWFGLRLPVFIGTEPITIPVRLRYKVIEGVIKFSYLFHNFDQVLEETVNQAIAKVRADLPDLHVVEGIA